MNVRSRLGAVARAGRWWLAVCLSAWATVRAADNAAFDEWAEAFAREWVRANPNSATVRQYLAGAEQEAADRELILIWSDGMPVLPAERAASVERARRGLAELGRFPVTSLTPVQRTSAALLTWRFKNWIRAAECADQRYVFDQFRGVHIGPVMLLTEAHPLRNARDVDNYLARLERIAPLLDLAIKEAQAQAERGVLPPRFIIEATVSGLDRLLAPPVEKNVFVDTLAKGLAKIATLPDAQRTAAVSRARTIVAEATLPAYQRVRDWLVTQRERATDQAGVWKLPRGGEFYASSLAAFTTTNLGAEEIHAIGRREVARIEDEMDRLLRQLGYAEGSVQSRYLLLQASLLPKVEPDPRPAIVEEITRVVRDAEMRAEALFDVKPKAPVEVRREPAFTEAGAAARYSVPAPDGSRPGIYWIPLARIAPDVIWLGAGMRSVAYHEAVPGHHFQLALQQESTELPRFRKLGAYGGISAHSEGWALYAERIAEEAGWYEGDVPGRLGYLALQLLRARRLVVDTGLHAKRWTRQQAIDYGVQASEVERYVVWPGQACSYMIGQLRILELRERAKAALGARFSLKEFHNLVLRVGELPLDVLEQEVDAWIAAKRG